MSRQTVLLGSSAATRVLDGDLTIAGRSDSKVLITGESGVGKEVAARIVHERSPRSGHSMVTVNCAGLPESLLETELFGHVKGSFTGAYRDKPGLLHIAHRGTIFLDEVGEMSLRMQALLLRFLETGEVQSVGTDKAAERLDVRVICATHRDLRERVRDETFREDLFYRLNVIHIHITPLRERREDIVDLLQAFMRDCAARQRRAQAELTPAALDALTCYAWPGNARELRNVVERLTLRETPVLDVEDLPTEVRLASLPAIDAAPAGAGIPTDTSAQTVARALLSRLLAGESFWDVVYEPFAAHDLTREHLRLVVSFGLGLTQGRYSALTKLFNMKPGDYNRFRSILRKHDCLVSFHPFRNARPESLEATMGSELGR